MKISKIETNGEFGGMIFLPSPTSFDSSNGIRSNEELENWKNSFLEKFGDAELIRSEYGHINVDLESNAKYKEWYHLRFADKAEFVRKYGCE